MQREADDEEGAERERSRRVGGADRQSLAEVVQADPDRDEQRELERAGPARASPLGASAELVVERDEGEVAGFGSLSPWRDRPAYSTTVEDSVYIHADHRGKGVGRALLTELVRTATAHGFHACMARIVGGHEASIRLHRGCGFELVGIEREVGRKFGRWLDVALMQRLL